jgi:hypothetical protein
MDWLVFQAPSFPDKVESWLTFLCLAPLIGANAGATGSLQLMLAHYSGQTDMHIFEYCMNS